MRLLLDQGLAYSTIEPLDKAGHDAIHVADLKLGQAPDSEIIRLAVAQGRTVVTLDGDFHKLLALSGARLPSVIRLRIEGLRAQPAGKVILTVIALCQEALLQGAAVTVLPWRIKIRPLPVRSERSKQSDLPPNAGAP